MPLSPQERTDRARRAALIRWSKQTPDNRAMRDGLQRKYERQVDPEEQLPPAERKRRAEAAYRADLVGWARKSVKVRQARAAGKSPASSPDDAA